MHEYDGMSNSMYSICYKETVGKGATSSEMKETPMNGC